tara:strand:+ start:996 stop:2678 length:1683 start_codon:yes stop_codon:yes gene_type:complete
MFKRNKLLSILIIFVAILVVIVGGLSASLLLSGESEESVNTGITTSTQAGAENNLSVGQLRLSGSDPVTLDPHLATDAGSAEYIVEIYSGLVTISPDLELTLDLASSVDISDDGITYTFELRDDIFFHSGRRVTAEDVTWSIKRALSRKLQSTVSLAYLGDILGAREYFFGLSEDITGLELIDDKTIQFTLDSPKPFFLAKLTYPCAFVVDGQQIEVNERNWTRKPNGTGPYKLKEWRLSEQITLYAHDRYHLGIPPLKEVVYLLSGGSALTRFENDELDVAFISVNDVERARDVTSDLNPLYSVWPQFTISYFAFNIEKPPFDDVHIRRALGLSIDRKKIAEVTFSDMLAPATGILAPGLPGYTDVDKTLPFNPNLAREELLASKYKVENGQLVTSQGEVVPIVITEVGGGAEARIDTQAFLEQWRTELGVNVEIRQTDFATYLAESDAKQLQMFNGGWIMDYPDPENILDLKFHSQSGLNDLGYQNTAVDELLELARSELNPDQRIALYRDAEKLILEDAAWLPLYFSQNHVVVNADVNGWFEPPMVVPRLRFIEVNR